MSDRKSFSVGRSTANQRIEILWSFLKKHFTQYWGNIFKDMITIESGDFDNTDMMHLECTCKVLFFAVDTETIRFFSDELEHPSRAIKKTRKTCFWYP